MSNIVFHNKFHRSSHHTVATPGYPDSNKDPIASLTAPFSGIFYNEFQALTGQAIFDIVTFSGVPIITFLGIELLVIDTTFFSGFIFTDSKTWHETKVTIQTLSGDWEKYPTTYTTTKENSGNWSLGYSGFQTLENLNLDSLEQTYNEYISYWSDLPNAWRTNKVQEDTGAKNFKGVNLEFVSNSAFWDLSGQQAGYITFPGISADYYLKNIIPPEQKKKGGIYYLVVQQSLTGNENLHFDSDYVFQYPLSGDNVIRLQPLSITAIKFVCDGNKLYGKATYFTLNGLNDITYFAGPGIILSPNPGDLFFGEVLVPGGGTVIVFGPAPYSSSPSINIV